MSDLCSRTDSADVLPLLEREESRSHAARHHDAADQRPGRARALRNSERYAHLPVLILTAVDDREIKSQALSLGRHRFPGQADRSDRASATRPQCLALKAHHDRLENYAHDLEREVKDATRSSKIAAGDYPLSRPGRANIATTKPDGT